MAKESEHLRAEEELRGEVERLLAERDALRAERDALQAERDALRSAAIDNADALHHSQLLLRSIAEHSPAVIYVKDLEGRFLLSNRQHAVLLGETPETMAGRYEQDFLSAEEAAEIAGVTAEVLASGRLISKEFRLSLGADTRWFFEQIFPLFDASGAPFAIAGISTDVTRRKSAEAALAAQNDELADALLVLQRTQDQLVQAEKMASLGLLVAGVAHELKNPLNFVGNFAELSIERIQEIQAELQGRESLDTASFADVLAELAANLSRIQAHGHRADAIINSMLMHARKRPGELVSAQLNELVADHATLAYQGFRRGDPSFRAEFTLKLDEAIDVAPLAYSDIARVVMNLVDNACHATRERIRQGHPGYSATIEVRTQVLEDGGCRVSVRDNGIGIPPSLQRRVFDPFFTTKPAGDGTGLGLSMSYELIVGQLGGTIEVRSEQGLYTLVSFTLPPLTPPQSGAE